MKTFNRYQDIVISFNEDRERWYPRLGPLGVTPDRPMFKTKAEASDAAKAAFERWQNRDVIDDGTGMTTLMLETD